MAEKPFKLKLWIAYERQPSTLNREEKEKQLIGTVLHKSIELFLKYGFREGIKSPDIPAVDKIVEAAWVAVQSGKDEFYDEETARIVLEESTKILKRAFSSEDIRQLLSGDDSQSEIYTEVEIMNEKGRLFRIDLLRINSSNREIEVVDFKTHETDDAADKRQLTQYIALIRKVFGSPWKVKGFVIYLDPPKRKELQ